MSRLLDFSEDFVLSSDTLSIHITKGLVLLLYCRPEGELILPKARKKVGDTLEAAAIREPRGSQGSSGRLFKLQLLIKAQQVEAVLHIEPIAVQ